MNRFLRLCQVSMQLGVCLTKELSANFGKEFLEHEIFQNVNTQHESKLAKHKWAVDTYQSEWRRDGTKDEIGHGQIWNEDVAHDAHLWTGEDSEKDQAISQSANDRYKDVENNHYDDLTFSQGIF